MWMILLSDSFEYTSNESHHFKPLTKQNTFTKKMYLTHSEKELHLLRWLRDAEWMLNKLSNVE